LLANALIAARSLSPCLAISFISIIRAKSCSLDHLAAFLFVRRGRQTT
jgi:hypothetical protein